MVLDEFVVFQKLPAHYNFKAYSLTLLVSTWLQNVSKAQATIIRITADYSFDINFVIIDKRTTITTSKSEIDEPMK